MVPSAPELGAEVCMTPPVVEEMWQFGTINRVHPGGELIDISYENGDESIGIPTYDVECV